MRRFTALLSPRARPPEGTLPPSTLEDGPSDPPTHPGAAPPPSSSISADPRGDAPRALPPAAAPNLHSLKESLDSGKIRSGKLLRYTREPECVSQRRISRLVDRIEDELAAAAAADDREDFLLAPQLPPAELAEFEADATAEGGEGGEDASRRSAWSFAEGEAGAKEGAEGEGKWASEAELNLRLMRSEPSVASILSTPSFEHEDSYAGTAEEGAFDAEGEDGEDVEDGEDGEGGKGEREGGKSEAEGVGEEVEAMVRSGFLTKKAGAFSGTRKRWFVLKQGSLLWFKAQEEEASGVPQGYCHLNECKLLVPDEKGSRLYGYTFVLHGRKEYILTASSAAERTAWLKAIKHNCRCKPLTSLDARPEETDGGAKKKKQGMMMRAETYVAKKVATSELGKRLLREFCLPGVMAVLDAVKNLLSKDPSLLPKQAQEHENTLLKIAVKMVLLFTHSLLKPRDLDQLNSLVEWMVIDLLMKWDECQYPPHRHAADPDHVKFCEQMKGIEAELMRCVGPHTTDSNLAKLKAVTSYFGTPDNVQRLVIDQVFKDDMLTMTNALRSLILNTNF